METHEDKSPKIADDFCCHLRAPDTTTFRVTMQTINDVQGYSSMQKWGGGHQLLELLRICLVTAPGQPKAF